MLLLLKPSLKKIQELQNKVANIMRVKVTQLKNGLTIVSERMKHLESAAVHVSIKSGSRNELENEHGIAHLLEHMAFKGTKRRTAAQIADEIESVGGELNAYTSAEMTSYYARVLKDDVPLALDLLSDILTHSIFSEAELKREQHVILQEIGAAHDTPDDLVFDEFQSAAYSNQPLGRPILGTPETVQKFSADDLRAFMHRNYTTTNTVVTVTGNIKHSAIVKMVEEHFADLAEGQEVPCSEAKYNGGEWRDERDLQEVQLVLGFEGPAYQMRDFYASQLLASLLGGGMSSRLFQQVREKKGLCYSIGAFHSGFSDTGIFGLHAATSGEDIHELIHALINELQSVSQHIEPHEVDRVRAQIRSGLLMSQESPIARAGQLARQMLLFGSPVANDELMERLEAITPERLTDLAKRLFTSSNLTLSVTGPINQLPDYDSITQKLNESLNA